MKQRKCDIFRAVALTLALATVSGLSADILRARSTQSSGPLEFVCDSVDFRPDLTRVYGKFNGRPHTSNRVDSMTMDRLLAPLPCTDLDGVDLKRWFQYEDEGTIPVEIDFGPCTPAEELTVRAVTARGQSVWKLTLIPKAEKTRKK